MRHDTNKGRFYDINGREYPSVTTILSAIAKPALINWSAGVERQMVSHEAWKLYDEIHGLEKMTSTKWALTLEERLGKEREHARQLRKAGEIGSQVHAMIEWTLRNMMCEKQGPSPSIGEKATWAFTRWLKWKDSVRLKPILIEHTVYSRTYSYAGTMDLLAEVEGKLCVVDWKTGKAVYPEAFLQNAAYRYASWEMDIADAPRGLIVRLPKHESDPDLETVDAGSFSENFATFLDVKKVWSWLNGTQEVSKEGNQDSTRDLDFALKRD